MQGDRALYLRQRMLPEIGEAGQERLRAARVRLDGDPRAVEIARDYLERAGVTVAPDGAPVRIEGGGGDGASAAVAGAYAAVEAIKSIVGAGTRGRLPEEIG